MRKNAANDLERRPAPGRKYEHVAVALTFLYTAVILGLAAWGGMNLYSWARERILSALPPESSQEVAVQTPQQMPGEPVISLAPVDRVSEPADLETPIPRPTPINVLLLGTDERPDEGAPMRTDTIILMTLDPASQTAGMLSLPRDLWVPIPGFNITTKINTAYGMGERSNYPGGGEQLVMDTVGSFVGQPVPYFVRVNFNGFVDLVNLIGGIDVNVAKTIHDDKYPTDDYGVETFHMDAGPQHLDGEMALKYARTRNVDDDYGRSRRQQEVLRAVFEKVRSAEMIPTLLANAPRLLYTLGNSVATNIPLGKQLELASYVNENPPREIRQLVLDSRYGEETYSAEGAWILLPDRARVRAAVNTFFTPPAAHSENITSIAQGDPRLVQIEILNGTGQPGMAARARDLLQAQGWQVVSIGDADRGDYSQTVLINYDISDAVAKEVGAALGLQANVASVSGLNPATLVDARIVLGRDIIPLISQ
jgi:LCP family protein required for cell wall assembly